MMKKVKNKLNLFDKVVLFLNVIVALAIVVSYFAPYADPQKYWPVAFFGLAYPPLLLANVICLAYWVLRLKKYAFLSLICILAGWHVLRLNVGFESASPTGLKKSDRYLRVINYNVHSFTCVNVYNDAPTKRQMMGLIRLQQPDIIGFEEFYSRHKGEFDTPDTLKKILNTKSYYYQQLDIHPEDNSGLAIFSKYPIVNKGLINLTPGTSDNKSIFVDVQYNAQIVRVYCIHLQSIHFEPEDYAYLDNAEKGSADMRSSRRIGGKLKLAFLKRSKQVKMLKEHAAQCPYPYIFCGDFNDTPSSYAVAQMAEGLKNTFEEKGSGLGKTYNGDFPNYQIDYIMASPQFNVMTYKVIEKKLSDHYAVQTDLLLK